jgi:hypothetical protein
MAMTMDLLVKASHSPDARLPYAEPLTLTRNFGLVVGFCVAVLVLAPLLIAWTASVFLT